MKSDKHKEAQEIVRDYYRQKGWIAIVEAFVRNKKIDVLSQDISTKHTIANEIQLSAKHFIENIQLDFEAGCNEVSIICIDKKILEKIKKKTLQELNQEFLGKIKFQLIEEFIPLQTNIKNNRNKAELNPETNPEQNPKAEGGEKSWKNRLA